MRRTDRPDDQCEDFDEGSKLLRADYSIDCRTVSHDKYVAFSGVMAVVYPIGVPALYLASLWPYRSEMMDPQLRESPAAKSRHLVFFYADYKPGFWWWETVELIRKLVMTGFMVVGEWAVTALTDPSIKNSF